MTETVLVTGGTGFVAGWCVAELLERGFEVRTTVRDRSKERAVRAAAPDAGDRLTVVAADLTADAGWDAAVDGCDHVLHVASPLGVASAKRLDDLIVPAREGTLRVLRAATRAGVGRVVVTSACAAASPPSYTSDGVTDETLWTDADDPRLNAYRRSKTVAERAAWDFMREYEGPTTLSTILPGAVFGPVRSKATAGSVEVIGRLLAGKIPGIPRIGFEVVDVRDLVDAHIRAMTAPAAAGQRFIAVGEFLWMADIARILRESLGDAAGKVPARNLPDFVPRLLALFDPGLRDVLPALGRRHRHTPAKAHRLLGWHSRPAAETVVDCARSLLATTAA